MTVSGPTTETMIERWNNLARSISTAEYSSEARGELIVLGSGISFVDLTRDAEAEIRSADAVFHCVYDKVTQIWLGQIRPDGFDLRVLYGENIDRHNTYVRMAEAMLHFVRMGKKVVAVFYGHPGVFAMPAHRAIHIARSEGHFAKMRPGISALDYLVADIGFDPALPGFASFEATDLLLRSRRVDPSLHVVIWQVGVVGEFQFQPEGFKNDGFELLVDYLTEIYGPDWKITHYIAPQYVGIEPLIVSFKLSQLLAPEVRSTISALSTFYIEPQQFGETDWEISTKLGYSRRGMGVPKPFRVYDYTCYGQREQAAVKGFARFTAPSHYKLAPYSPEYEFMLDLSNDLKKQANYRRDPVATVRESQFQARSDRRVRLLTIPHPSAIDAALNGDPEP
jgi:Tetrapyrrole (Corrin/Porphyrin) Methylases